MTTSTLLATEPSPPAVDQEAKVAEVWNRHWGSFTAERLSALYERLGQPAPWYRRPFTCGPQDEVRIFERVLGSLAGRRTLEFGAGIGWTSLWLARAGADVTVADISSAALELSRSVFARAGCRGRWQEASIFATPAPQDGHDLVFNSGLIEHFHRPDQIRLLRNMAALTKPGGLVGVIAPYAGAHVYQWSKRRMERRGTWRFGDEFPLRTMVDLGEEVGLQFVSEETAKPGDQWNFLAGVNRPAARLGMLAQLLTLGEATPLWSALIGDSMIATVFRKPI